MGGRIWPLSDFIAPADIGKGDYIGAFVVTSGAQEGKIADRFAKANDDYGSIMVKALADRIAEALAERMHETRPARILGLCAG